MARVVTFPHRLPRTMSRAPRAGAHAQTPPASAVPPISNAQLGMTVFIAFESMMFVGLITAYWVLRTNSFAWPPPNLPRLPVAVTWVNTAVLMFSGVMMWRACAGIRAGDQPAFRAALVGTGILGVGFLAVQGTEWVRLIHQGLTLSAGSYASTFYLLIGLHGVHVLGAVIWLLTVLVLAQRGRFSAGRHVGVTLCAMYWYFVCALWVVLFGAVYLY